MDYLLDCYMQDVALQPEVVEKYLVLAASNSKLSFEGRSEDGMSLLHLAVMNEGTDPPSLATAVELLLGHGAPPNERDDDGDTPLEAILALGEELDREQQKEGGDPDGARAGDDEPDPKEAHVAVVRSLIRFPATQVGMPEALKVCAWLRRHAPKSAREVVLQDLRDRLGPTVADGAWASEELINYLEDRGYEDKGGVEPDKVAAFLARGATPTQTQNGASALQMVVLNPYSTLEQLDEVYRMLLRADPCVLPMRDGFSLSPFMWAMEYASISQQHGLETPNPAALLALIPAIASEVPADIDGGEVCIAASPSGRSRPCPPPGAPRTRFPEGHCVFCRVATPGHKTEWEEGIIVGTWYREKCWPRAHSGAPYEIQLLLGSKVFALVDDDRIVRETPPAKGTGAPEAVPTQAQSATPAASQAPAAVAGGGGPARTAQEKTPDSAVPSGTDAPASRGGARFQKRALGDGWELLDTKSGKARPCSPPDSDDD